jgi:hypothetical protein
MVTESVEQSDYEMATTEVPHTVFADALNTTERETQIRNLRSVKYRTSL